MKYGNQSLLFLHPAISMFSVAYSMLDTSIRKYVIQQGISNHSTVPDIFNTIQNEIQLDSRYDDKQQLVNGVFCTKPQRSIISISQLQRRPDIPLSVPEQTGSCKVSGFCTCLTVRHYRPEIGFLRKRRHLLTTV